MESKKNGWRLKLTNKKCIFLVYTFEDLMRHFYIYFLFRMVLNKFVLYTFSYKSAQYKDFRGNEDVDIQDKVGDA